MTLFDKYRPKRLSEVVGQPAAAMLGRFVRKPFRSCWLLEGPPGTGKSACAHALAEELGCTIFSKHVVSGNKLTRETAEQLFNHTVRCVPMDRARFHVVIVEEFERVVSPEVRSYLKTALDTGVEPPDGLAPRCIVVATSNDVAKIDGAILERFRVLQFSGGPCFAETAQERLAEIWTQERPADDMPAWWQHWGWQGERFSMRVAVREMEDYLSLSAELQVA
jgi:replication-associated recombination protein RarA